MTAPTTTSPAAEPLALPVVGSLSPSRASDFLTCPLLYRFRTIDRLPEPPSSAATRGTLVHAALEALFDLPAAERTPARAHELLGPAWRELQESEPEVAALFADETELAEWLRSARGLVDAYFALEDPRRLEPAAREELVEVLLPGGLRLRGIVDRLDVAPSGDLRVVDYKGLALDTPLPTPSGWTTMADVAVGQQLLGADGRPTTVTLKSDVHHRPCYEVRFTDGSTVVCDNVHLWSVHVASTGEGYEEQVLDTDALARLVNGLPKGTRRGRRPFVRATAALDLPTRELPIDPWLLGAWLGGGAARGGSLTVGHADRDDMLTLLKEHWAGRVSVEPASEAAGALTVSLLRPRQDMCPYGHDDVRDVQHHGRTTRRCRREREHRSGRRWNAALSELLRQEGLTGDKHVPLAYLRASRDQRLALLRGLMDTDGSWSQTHQRAVFVTTSARLASAVRELVQSLGWTSSVVAKPYTAKAGPREAHMVVFRPEGSNPFCLPRKAAHADAWLLTRTAPRNGAVPRELRRTIAAVNPVASVATQCVEVDAPDSLYLCGRTLVPTHNTGRAPREAFEGKALFQMKFYGLVLWRTRGVVPRMLQLMYLGDGEVLRYEPEESDLLAVERKLLALWSAIERATLLRDFRPRRSRLCDWCSHQALCPEFGGTPPPWPERVPGPDDLLPHQQRARRAPVPHQG